VFEVVDTPGLADTRGIGRDNAHVDAILEAAGTVRAGVTALVLVAKGTNPRLTVNQLLVLRRLGAQFPDAVLATLVLVLTKCSALNANVSPEMVQGELGLVEPPRCVHLDNSVFLHPRAGSCSSGPSGRRPWRRWASCSRP